MMEFKCKKSLFKRTYGTFTCGQWYTLVDRRPALDRGIQLIMAVMRSNEGLESLFVLNFRMLPYYYFDEYFDISSERVKDDENIIDDKLKLFIEEHS